MTLGCALCEFYRLAKTKEPLPFVEFCVFSGAEINLKNITSCEKLKYCNECRFSHLRQNGRCFICVSYFEKR